MTPAPYCSIDEERSRSLNAGAKLAHPEPGEEVVITGLSGSFPNSSNIHEFRDQLMNKIDLVSGDGRRYVTDHPEIPKRSGKLNTLNKFDSAFFGIHCMHADTMDPMGRILLERSYEAIVDAGYNPFQLRGARCGVFLGACFSETEKTFYYEKTSTEGTGALGCFRAVMANKISYWLGVNGPCYNVDSACSSSLYALDHAYTAIRNGLCDMAIVAGANLCLHPYVSLQFSRLGVLSMDGASKSFDNRANGYCRSEAIPVVFIQKSKDARRIYARVVHSKTNCDGYKELGITYPSGEVQLKLLKEFYEECGVDPLEIDFLEAHGTGTKVGDPEECNALDKMFCKKRTTPLLLGSVKSNMGHSEPAAGLCSIAKIIIAMETGKIPPNLHYGIPRDGVPAFVEGRLKVVTDVTDLPGGYVGTNSFGFGGANGHILLRWNDKTKTKRKFGADEIPRLVCVSGRTQEAVETILNDLESRELDEEYTKLYHELHSTLIPGHLYRGYTILSTSGKSMKRHVQYCNKQKRPLWFVFSGIGSQWQGMGRELLKIPVFAKGIDKCRSVLEEKGVDLIRILTEDEPKNFDNLLNTFVGITSVQIALVDTMSALGVTADGYLSYSIGELAASYMEGYLTADQAILVAYYMGLTALETRLKSGMNVRVYASQQSLKNLLTDGVEVSGIDSPHITTISGPTDQVKKLLITFKASDIRYELIDCGKLPFHTSHLVTMETTLKTYLDKVISHPKVNKRFPSVTMSSQYYSTILSQQVDFVTLTKEVPGEVVLLELGPSCILGRILKNNFTNDSADVLNLCARSENSLLDTLVNLGSLYESGTALRLDVLYPEVRYPVSRGTPMISPLIKWDHSKDWFVSQYKMIDKMNWGERRIIVRMDDEDMEFMTGHVIDGRNLFPATGYLVMVWETMARTLGMLFDRLPVVFKRIRFDRATSIPKDGAIEFTVMIQKGSGKFEVVEGGVAVVTGVITAPDNLSKDVMTLPDLPVHSEKDKISLTARDIYKELRLRGYQYTGLFRGLTSFNLSGTSGKVTWSNNWVAFMDNILQAEILNKDTRDLYVPTAIDKLVIDPVKHADILVSLGEEKEFPVKVYPPVKIIESGGVQITNLQASQIPRRRPLGEPVLEKYSFQPHCTHKLVSETVDEIISLCTHLALENVPGVKVKVVELKDELLNTESPLVAPYISTLLGDLPLIQADVVVLSTDKNQNTKDLGPRITVEDKKIPTGDHDTLFIVGTKLIGRKNILSSLSQVIKTDGFLISREAIDQELDLTSLNVVVDRRTNEERVLMFNMKKKSGTEDNVTAVVKVDQDFNFNWLSSVREEIKSTNNQTILLVAEDGPTNGIVGLVNCLRKEPGGEKVRCVFVMDTNAPPFSLKDPFYAEQISKSLAVNVYKNGQWGSYRHQTLRETNKILVEHAYLNNTVKGDLSSIRWNEGPYNANPKLLKDSKMAAVYYASVNFRDVMLFSGKLSSVTLTIDRRQNSDLVTGFEYVGRNMEGKRIMGMIPAGAAATVLLLDKVLTWEVPDHWSLEEAATVPVVYATALYALVTNGKMKKGDSVLIHSGTGGVGLAALTLAVHYGCTVFTTVGTQEKRDYIHEMFPEIPDENIGCSRDLTFEEMVMRRTEGRGVDMVLNSLAGDKLKASLRCLAPGGRFLEIGKFDIMNNTPLCMEALSQGRSFHGVMLDCLFDASEEKRKELHCLLQREIENGSIVPLRRTVFNVEDAEQAIRYMTTGKHIGKVLIKIRDEEAKRVCAPSKLLMEATPRFYCNPDRSYVVIGGLGGVGLEIVDWLAIRGARHIVLSSRSGVKTGYQALRVKTWQGYGIQVSISTEDVTTRIGMENLLKTARKLAPVAGVFNLAVVLKDAIFENLSEEDFKISFSPKAVTTQLLDELTRQLCPELEHFVIFSSVSCGRGNAGQTNYGMANSVMERICEVRKTQGLPGLAIQWGAVGDVGLVADMQEEHKELVIGGTLQQPINSCIQCLDIFMKQKEPVVSSMVVAEKRAAASSGGGLVETVANILGIRDMKTVSMHSSLAEVGMDSMMAVEIKQTLEREFDVFMTAQDIRSLTFAKLIDIAAKESEKVTEKVETVVGEEIIKTNALELILRLVGDEKSLSKPYIELKNRPGKCCAFLVPGIEGAGAVFKDLVENLEDQDICLQLPLDPSADSIEELARRVLPVIKAKQNGPPYKIIGYSLGSLVALDLAQTLQEEGNKVSLYLLDGAPDFLRSLFDTAYQDKSEDEVQTYLLDTIHTMMMKEHDGSFLREVAQRKTWEDKLECYVSKLPEDFPYSKHYQRLLTTAVYKRMLSVKKYKPRETKVDEIVLVRPKEEIMKGLEEDYDLQKYSKETIKVHFVDGDHVTMLNNMETVNILNGKLRKSEQTQRHGVS